MCACGNETNTIRYSHGKKTCNKCGTVNLSGTFLRHLEGEANYYAKDILQKHNKDGSLNENFKEVYGTGRNVQ